MKSQVNISLQKEVMKIALIMVKGNVYGFKNRSFIFKYMPDSLTLGTLYGIIKHSFPEIEVEIYDETVETLKKENIKADLIGISAITWYKQSLCLCGLFSPTGNPCVYWRCARYFKS